MPPRVLVISLTPLHRDARVLRQVAALRTVASVQTVGYGPPPPDVAGHLEIDSRLHSLPRTPGGVAALTARRFSAAEELIPATRFAERHLSGPPPDLVVVNDARALPLGFRAAAGAPVWADMHEYAPEERTQDPRWRVLVAPFADHLCRRYLPRCHGVSTVCHSLAVLYERRYGVRCLIVRNAASYAELRPSAVDGSRVRLVHSGAAVPGRRLESLIDATALLPRSFTLDLYLVPGGDGGAYLQRLRTAASRCERVRFPAPVAPDLLPQALNGYDVGVFFLEPINTNARFALPNKLFDYIQARLALAVGPSPEMRRLVEETGSGWVANGNGVRDIVRLLQPLDAEDIRRRKQASHAAAAHVTAEDEMRPFLQTIRSLV